MSSDFSDEEGWTIESYYGTIQFPDLNGDGDADVCGLGPSGISCGLGAGETPFSAATTWLPAFAGTYWLQPPERYMPLEFPDLNGDGSDDFCVRAVDGTACFPSKGTGLGDFWVWTRDFEDVEGWAPDPSRWSTVQYPDIDGDGRADLCGRDADGIICARNNFGYFEAARKWSLGDVFSDAQQWDDVSLARTIQFPDINGDGSADVCSRTGTSIVCQLASSGAFGNTIEVATFPDPSSTERAPVDQWATIQFPDIDGDGRADLCGRTADGLLCGLSTGDSIAVPTLASAEFSDTNGFGASLYAGSIQFADLDGDGADDVCGRRADGVVCALSDRQGHFYRPTTLQAFTDLEGWNAPSWASTLTLVYLKRDIRPGCPNQKISAFRRRAARLLP